MVNVPRLGVGMVVVFDRVGILNRDPRKLGGDAGHAAKPRGFVRVFQPFGSDFGVRI